MAKAKGSRFTRIATLLEPLSDDARQEILAQLKERFGAKRVALVTTAKRGRKAASRSDEPRSSESVTSSGPEWIPGGEK